VADGSRRLSPGVGHASARAMIRRLPRLLQALGLAFVAALAACQPAVGDACEVQTDCGRSMYCERSLPGGYCTVRSCHVTPCPEDATCVVFDPDLSWCMALCDRDADCRSGYACVEDFASVPFCNDDRGEPPAPDEDAVSQPADVNSGDAAEVDAQPATDAATDE
jgi:hypothetical protein